MAGLAESVLAIDADESFIEGNLGYAAKHGVDNVEFRNDTVTPDSQTSAYSPDRLHRPAGDI